MRAARTGLSERGAGELIHESSKDEVLSTFCASAGAGEGDLRWTLEGLVQKGPVARVAGKRPSAVCIFCGLFTSLSATAAELFTSSGGAILPERFPRLCITPEIVSVQKLRSPKAPWRLAVLSH